MKRLLPFAILGVLFLPLPAAAQRTQSARKYLKHGTQLFAMTDDIAERVRKIGGTTLRSIGHIARLQRISDNDAEYVSAEGMLSELREDEKSLLLSMRSAHDLCDEAGDVATTSLLKNWIDQTQRRIWFLFEATRS